MKIDVTEKEVLEFIKFKLKKNKKLQNKLQKIETSNTTALNIADVVRSIFKEMIKDNEFIKKSEKHTQQFKEGYAESLRNLAIIIKEVTKIDVRN